MFLNEVALGKEHGITKDDWRLTKAPAGFDSIVARGRTEPGNELIIVEWRQSNFLKIFFYLFIC